MASGRKCVAVWQRRCIVAGSCYSAPGTMTVVVVPRAANVRVMGRFVSSNTDYPSRDEWWGRQAGSGHATARAGGVDSGTTLAKLREVNEEALRKIPEVRQLEQFHNELRNIASSNHFSEANLLQLERQTSLIEAGVDRHAALRMLKSGMMTFCSHTEGRLASFFGRGFYTIGPCGEELMAAVGELVRATDFVCLHYRHLATQFCRQMRLGYTIEESLLARARAHAVSIRDEVTGGVHCALGGNDKDRHSFTATSTLASQCPPAVGRALGIGLAARLGVGFSPSDAVSYVSVGDGSINNAHFLTAINFAEYAKFRGFKCPVVFGVTDNNLSISLPGYDWFTQGFLSRINMARFTADGRDLGQVYATTKKALSHARQYKEGVILAVINLPRRFGHAATDRQDAYLTQQEIDFHEYSNPLLGMAVAEGLVDRKELLEMFEEIHQVTMHSFEKAIQEPKVDVEDVMRRLHRASLAPCVEHVRSTSIDEIIAKSGRKQVMRKAMTQVLDELLSKYPDLVYIGEDVEHGGYYLVTEGLASKHKIRVRDFPPDETTLIGAGQGFSQVGLCPIVEIPYAKYLDCGFDMFLETIFTTWLTNAAPGMGMIYRLQGFDKGVFGGNHHTTNVLSLPPGLDVVCYSCGEDYVRGWRFLVRHARQGRMVMSVDSTNLLNKRHLHPGDDAWRRVYPDEGEDMHIHTVVRYEPTGAANPSTSNVLLVTYGNGVATCLEAATTLIGDGIHATVIDTPLISEVPHGLRNVLVNGKFDHIVFADVCKQGQHPYAGFICQLQAEKLLPSNWQCVTAMPTYNPLGSTITFLSQGMVVDAARAVVKL